MSDRDKRLVQTLEEIVVALQSDGNAGNSEQTAAFITRRMDAIQDAAEDMMALIATVHRLKGGSIKDLDGRRADMDRAHSAIAYALRPPDVPEVIQ